MTERRSPYRAKPTKSGSDLEELFAFQVKALGLPAPRREFVFAPPRRFRADFAWPASRLLVEIEGGQFSRRRHLTPLGYEKDCEKYNTASAAGWVLLRFTTRMVHDGRAIEAVRKWFEEER